MKKLKRALEPGANMGVAGQITASFALPDEFEPRRMRNEYSTEATALFKVNEEHKPTWMSRAASGEQLNPNTHIEFIFNDVLRNRIVYEAAQGAWSYAWRFGRSATGAAQTAQQVYASTNNDPSELTHAVSTGAFSPHGDTIFALRFQSKKGIWVDTEATALSTITVTLAPAPGTSGGSIVYWQFINGQWQQAFRQAILVATTGYTWQPTQSAYYFVEVINPQAAEAVSVTSSGTCGCWGHKYLPFGIVNAASMEAVRLLGQSILVRNIAAPLNQQGNITGIQPGKGRYWFSFASQDAGTDPYPVIADYAGANASRRLATGMYAFKKPTEEADFKFKEAFVVENIPGSTNANWVGADSTILDVEYIVVAAQCTVAAGRDLLVRTVHAGEYETSNQFLMVAKPVAEPEDWRAGIEALASMQQFYDNPVHWKRILSTIGQIASVSGRIMSMFGGRGAAIGIPLSMAGDAGQQLLQ